MSNTEIMTVDEQTAIIEWTMKNWQNFRYNELNGGYFIFTEFIEESHDDSKLNLKVSNIISSIRNRVIEAEKLHCLSSEPSLQDFIYYMNKNTKLHKHKDANSNDGYHIRFNVIIQLPEKGGVPIYGGKKMYVQERCYLVCRSGIDYHTSSVIDGDVPKIVISFGFNFPKQIIHIYPNLFDDILQNKS